MFHFKIQIQARHYYYFKEKKNTFENLSSKFRKSYKIIVEFNAHNNLTNFMK